MKTPKIFLLVLNYNGKEDTLQCLTSLSNVNMMNVKTVVLDNGSTDGSIEAIQNAFPHLTLIDNKENLGYAQGNNVGMKYAYDNGADYILILNNDVKVDPNFIQELLSAAKENPQGGIFGSAIYRYDNPEKIEHLGGFWSSSVCEFQSVRHLPPSPISVDYVCGCVFFIRREVIEKIGYFEPKFFLLWEEADYCFRAKRANFEIWAVPKAKVWHKISASFTGRAQMHYFWWRNRLFWIKRNLSKKEKRLAYRKILLPEIFKIYKLRFFKKLQLFFTFDAKKKKKRNDKYLRYKSGCRGIRDYYLHKLGNTYKKV